MRRRGCTVPANALIVLRAHTQAANVSCSMRILRSPRFLGRDFGRRGTLVTPSPPQTLAHVLLPRASAPSFGHRLDEAMAFIPLRPDARRAILTRRGYRSGYSLVAACRAPYLRPRASVRALATSNCRYRTTL